METLLQKMCEVEFPGHEKVRLFKDPTELNHMLAFFLQISALVSLKRTGNTRSHHNYLRILSDVLVSQAGWITK